MNHLSEFERSVLRHIERESNGGLIGATVSKDLENSANRSIILGHSTMDADGGRRLTVSGRRRLYELSVSAKKTMVRLADSADFTVIKTHMFNFVLFELINAGLIECNEIARNEYACKLTIIGQSWVNPPPLSLPTHIIRLMYDTCSSPTQFNVKFSGRDQEAEERMLLLWETYVSEDLSRRTAFIMRAADGERIARIRQPAGEDDPTHRLAFDLRH